MIEQFYYAIALLISIAGLTVIDRRFKLAYWFSVPRTGETIVGSMLVFIVWDALGIGLGIFFHGGSRYTLPYRLAPEFPIEELLFLYLLSYVTLLLYRAGAKLWPRT